MTVNVFYRLAKRGASCSPVLSFGGSAASPRRATEASWAVTLLHPAQRQNDAQNTKRHTQLHPQRQGMAPWDTTAPQLAQGPQQDIADDLQRQAHRDPPCFRPRCLRAAAPHLRCNGRHAKRGKIRGRGTGSGTDRLFPVPDSHDPLCNRDGL